MSCFSFINPWSKDISLLIFPHRCFPLVKKYLYTLIGGELKDHPVLEGCGDRYRDFVFSPLSRNIESFGL